MTADSERDPVVVPCAICTGDIPEQWATILGYTEYEASNYGQIRVTAGVTHLSDGRQRTREQQLIAQWTGKRKNGKPAYPRAKVNNDAGERKSVEVHRLQMLAFVGEPPAGQTCRHLDDVGEHNHWAPDGTGNLAYGDSKDQRWDYVRNHPAPPAPPPAPKPVVLCGPHGLPVVNGSKLRCASCMTELGRAGAALIAGGMTPADAAAQLGYSSPDGLLRQAKAHGGLIEETRYTLAPGTPPVTCANVPDGSRRRVSSWLRRLARRGGDSQ